MDEEELYTSIENYYEHVNSIERINSTKISSLADQFRAKSIALDEVSKQLIELEIDCLYFIIRNGQIKPLYSKENKDGIIVSYPNLSSINDSHLEYLKKRLQQLNNIYFKVRFSHIIWNITKEYEFAKQTINNYFLLINTFRKLDKENPLEHYSSDILCSLWNLQDLVFSIKYNVDDFKNLILDILQNPNKKSSGYLRLQLDCIKILLEKAERKIFTKDALIGLEELCQEVLKGDLNELFASDYLITGEKISRILKTGSEHWVLKQAEYYETLSKTENSIIAPEYCQKAINLYRKLNNHDKINELYKRYSFLSKSIELKEFRSETVDLTPYIQEYEKIVNELSSDDLLKFIIYSSDILPKYNEDKQLAEKQNEEHVFLSLFHTTVIDEFGHIIGKIETDEEEIQHQMYKYCDIWCDMEAKILSHFFKKAIEQNKVNSQIVLKFLAKTWYGANIKKTLSGGEKYEYNWLQYIAPSIESFFTKFEKFIQGDKSFNLYIQEIDSLSLKIEGIIRDLISLADVEHFHAFYFDKNKNFSWRNVNQYLKDPNIFNIIPENEVYFFKYLLTEHKNLRNRVAHSLMFLGEYDIYNMIMVLIAVLRLSKCIVLNKEKQTT